MSESPFHPIYLIKGDDPALLSGAVSAVVDPLIGDRPLDLTVQEIADDAEVGAVIAACQTPSFLSDRRIIVVRNVGRFRADEVEPLVEYLAAPMPTSVLVLVGGGGAVPSRLQKAIKQHGHIVDASVPTGKGRQTWLSTKLKKAPVRLDRSAANTLSERLGEELGQLTGLLDALASAYGEGATIDVDMLDPFLGSGGAAAPWELTDAIDSGDADLALHQLRRMLERGQRHPLVVMATLTRHYSALLALDGADVTSEAEAARLLGMAPYPAKKAMAQARSLGSTNVARAVLLVARADIDLRGASAWPPQLVLEVLIARLAKLRGAKRAQPAFRRPA